MGTRQDAMREQFFNRGVEAVRKVFTIPPDWPAELYFCPLCGGGFTRKFAR